MSKVKSRVFIVGVGRSGTSLLQSILGTHSLIHPLKETALLRNCVFENRSLDYSKVDRIGELQCALYKNTMSPETIALQYDSFVESLTSEYVLDKDPRLIEYLDYINQRFPNSKIICLVRDPRDVLCSKMKAEWSKNKLWITSVLANSIHIRYAALSTKRDNILVVRYEDLVKNQLNCYKKIVNFLDLEFEISMLNHKETAELLVERDEFSWKKETLTNVNQSRVGVWRNELSKLQSEISFNVIRSELALLGYENQFHSTGLFRLVLLPIVAAIKIAVRLYIVKNRVKYMIWKYKAKY